MNESGGFTRFLMPFLIELSALVLMNKLLPRSIVPWWVALAGATATALVLEAMKILFVSFAERILLRSYSSVYGPLGLVPLVLIWMYASWLLVLLGAEIAHALQNLRVLEAEDRRQRDDEPINGLLAAQLLAAVAATHEAGGAGHPQERLVSDFGLTPQNIERVVARLKARGLIAEVRGDINGYIPGRAASTIRLDEVLSAFRATDIELAEGQTSAALRDLVQELDQSRRRRTADLTIADLMPAPSGTPREEAVPFSIVPPGEPADD